MYDYNEGDIIYLKYMRFADSNKIDYRVNGRPYLVFRIIEDKLLLLKIGSKCFEPQYLFSKVNVISKNKEKRESYVDMRYFFLVDKNKISIAIGSMFDEKNPHLKKSLHGSKISDKEFREIKNQVKVLESLKEIKFADFDKRKKIKKALRKKF